MSYKDITAGKKTAHALATRFIKSEKGTLGIEVAFGFIEGTTPETLNWVGWLSTAAIENTMKVLTDVLEFNGDDEVVPGTSNLKPDTYNKQKDIELVVEMEEYEGKSRPRIKWVNNPGTGSAFQALTPETVKSELGTIGFKAAFLAAKAGTKKAATQQPANYTVPF